MRSGARSTADAFGLRILQDKCGQCFEVAASATGNNGALRRVLTHRCSPGDVRGRGHARLQHQRVWRRWRRVRVPRRRPPLRRRRGHGQLPLRLCVSAPACLRVRGRSRGAPRAPRPRQRRKQRAGAACLACLRLLSFHNPRTRLPSAPVVLRRRAAAWIAPRASTTSPLGEQPARCGSGDEHTQAASHAVRPRRPSRNAPPGM